MPSDQPISVLEVLQGSTEFLKKQHVEQPRLNSEHLLAHVLGIPRLELYLQFDRLLEEKERAPLRDLLRRRGKGVPLQHLLGSADFFGRNFRCDHRALIPRPETEQLVERALTYKNCNRILDVGTGSGVIAITLALEKKNSEVRRLSKLAGADEVQEVDGAQQLSVHEVLEGASTGATQQFAPPVEFRKTSIEAIDLSPDALALAQENALAHAVSIKWHHGNLLTALSDSTAALFDLIIANLPYIATEEISTLSPEVMHDPKMALDGGPEGLDLIQCLIEQASKHLQPEGHLLLEIGKDQEEAVMNFLKQHDYRDIVALSDYQGVLRFIEARRH